MTTKHLEPILTPDGSRFVIYPIRHPDLYQMYQKHVACFWTESEIDLSKDSSDWETLTDNEKHYISMILAFFAASDGIVNENLAQRFLNDVQIAEARCFYGFQIAMENIHSITYANILDTYIRDREQKNILFNAISNYPCIKKKADWAIKYIQDKRSSFAIRLVAFAIVEGIFFSGAFCSIFWFKKRGLLPGLCFANELISKDESMHTEFAIMLYSKLVKRLDAKKVFEIIKEAVEIEIEFICDALPCRLLGMNSDLMSQYIKYIADRLANQLGYKKIYMASNPFSFMEMISLESKSNMFERRISEYALSDKSDSNDAFSFQAEF